MNYTKFKKYKDIELRLLSLLGILKEESRIIQLNNYPDYDLSNYEGLTEKPYFFRDSWDFSNDYAAIINASIDHISIFHFDDVRRLASEYKVPFELNNSVDVVLNRIREQNIELMSIEGTDPDFDGFKLNEVRIAQVDQFRKTIEFFGGYSGASDSIQPMDWNILIECSFYGFVCEKFYANLIAESFALRNAGNNKISYFLAFSALENYINEHLSSHEKKEGRLKEKLSNLFKSKFVDLHKHPIYTSLVGEYDSWEAVRHSIAHGKGGNEVTIETVEELTVFILTLLASIEEQEVSFDSLHSKVSKHLPAIRNRSKLA